MTRFPQPVYDRSSRRRRRQVLTSTIRNCVAATCSCSTASLGQRNACHFGLFLHCCLLAEHDVKSEVHLACARGTGGKICYKMSSLPCRLPLPSVLLQCCSGRTSLSNLTHSMLKRSADWSVVFRRHFAAPNMGPATRLGLYMKFRARAAPSACGPLLFPSRIARLAPRLLPHHRLDGRCLHSIPTCCSAAMGTSQESTVLNVLLNRSQTIDRVVWIVEDGVSHQICVRTNGDGWQLPGIGLPSLGPI